MYCPACGAANENKAKFCGSCGEEFAGETGKNPPPPPPPPRPPEPMQSQDAGEEFPFGDWLNRSFNIVFQDIADYFILGLLVGLLSIFSVGILAGPLCSGSIIVIRKYLRGQGKVDLSSVFSEGFKFFGQTFLLFFIPTVALMLAGAVLLKIPAIGYYMVSLLGLAASGLVPILAITIHYVTEENLDFITAVHVAVEKTKNNIVMYWVFGLVAGMVCVVGAFAVIVGMFLTVSVSLVLVSLMLESQFPKK